MHTTSESTLVYAVSSCRVILFEICLLFSVLTHVNFIVPFVTPVPAHSG